MQDNILDVNETVEDESLEQNIRPQRLSEYVGQKEITDNYSVSITDATPHTFAVVFPPQAWNDEPFLTIVADGKTMTYYLTKDNFAAGHTYTLTLTVDNAMLRATNSIINWEVDEEPWTVTRYHQD